MISRRAAALLALPPLAFLAVFFVWPVASILALGIAPGAKLDLGGLTAALSESFVLQDLLFTLALAASATLATIMFGLPAALVFARYDFPGRATARALATVPFVLPTVVVASAFLALLGPRSAIVGTPAAILLASVFYNLAVVMRLVGGLWAHVDTRTEEAARLLGATPLRLFREVTWPLIRPSVASAASIVFLFNVTSFGLVLLLGGAGTTTLEVEIYRQTAQLLDLRTAAALSIVQIGTVLAVLLAYARAQERLSVAQRIRSAAETRRRPRTAGERGLVVGVLVALGLFLGAPLLTLAWRSFTTGGGFDLDAYASLLTSSQRSGLFVPPVEAIQNSIAFGVITLLLATSLGLMAAAVIGYRRGWLANGFDALVMLPLGTSAVTIGFGFIVTLNQPPLDLRTSPLLIPLAHALVATPFVLRVLVPVIRSIEPRLREAAAVLGASPRRTWLEVDLPVIRRAALVGAAFAFAVSLGEFGATTFIARPDTPTIPVAVARLLSLPGASPFGQAMAMSVILMLLTAACLLVVERLRGTGPEPF